MAPKTWCSLLPIFPSPKTHFQNLLPQASPKQRRYNYEPQTQALPWPLLSKRQLFLSSLALILTGFSPNLPNSISAEVPELERYTDSNEGFTLLRPSAWIKVDKAGATVLFEEANQGSNNVGVVVNPVRLSTLQEFGSPEFVADKLIQAERRKVIACSNASVNGHCLNLSPVLVTAGGHLYFEKGASNS